MQTGTPQTIYLKDYAPPDWLIDDVFLDVSLAPEATQVTARTAEATASPIDAVGHRG